MSYRYIIIIILAVTGFLACKKYSDPQGQSDPRLSRPYCNDPVAVNYNWDFPGTPNDSVCFYPSQVFSGTYSYQDSVYLPDNSLAYVTPVTMHLWPLTRTNIRITGFCPNGDSLNFTATRYYTASNDTLLGLGVPICSNLDTLTGTLTKYQTNDTFMLVDFTVVSDTGTTYHRGTAYKQ
ncbi:hypothetical protein [Taibaiella soli]|uniref:Uncharacterized protein n=1 Tax=Taibaiella soli TaxID=1649169 RepID=A0A2W2AS81_9BACT|nr:hypothetical protein [Taibaiella soli]PZF70844.1 hypothetical protein DN068_21630 [Taibaiella soli]